MPGENRPEGSDHPIAAFQRGFISTSDRQVHRVAVAGRERLVGNREHRATQPRPERKSHPAVPARPRAPGLGAAWSEMTWLGDRQAVDEGHDFAYRPASCRGCGPVPSMAVLDDFEHSCGSWYSLTGGTGNEPSHLRVGAQDRGPRRPGADRREKRPAAQDGWSRRPQELRVFGLVAFAGDDAPTSGQADSSGGLVLIQATDSPGSPGIVHHPVRSICFVSSRIGELSSSGLAPAGSTGEGLAPGGTRSFSSRCRASSSAAARFASSALLGGTTKTKRSRPPATT